MDSLALCPLSRAEAEKIYSAHLTRDFPPAELKPFSSISRMMEAGIYQPLGVYSGEKLAGYAFLTVIPGQKAALLDYLGVLPEQRSAGLGGQILSLLSRRYAGQLKAILIESEYPPESPEPALAERRLQFYRRAGARETAVAGRVFGVRYVLFALACAGSATEADVPHDEEVLRAMREIYSRMLPPDRFRENIFLGENALHPEYYHGQPIE